MDRSVSISCRLLVLALLAPSAVSAAEISVTPNGSAWDLILDTGPTMFHTTGAAVTNERVIAVPNTTVLLLLWDEQVAPDDPVPYYALSFDGVTVSRVYPTSYELNLPSVPTLLEADASNELYVVQFFTQPLRQFSEAIEDPAVGGTVRGYIPETSRIIEMNDATKLLVDGLEYVRSVAPHHPAYRLEPYLRNNIDQAEQLFPLETYNILVFERGLTQKTAGNRSAVCNG